ncbi:hypothetical protein WMY93_018102 [Mugilogobius chulae]|uniref:Galactosylgalactosylxylosylprotein 3-beta-glucuronosyltransferase n=1 Tax=Mugilogobius chulae TaxID=88201 RepID=A0AAW0NJ62_9GOBI
MKSVIFSRFFILLPWVLIVIIMIDIDTKRTFRSPMSSRQRVQRTMASNLSALPMIYAITPTYSRPVQKAELTRLAQAFRQVPRFHWIVVEDASSRSDLVTKFLSKSGVAAYTHLHIFTPRRFKRAGMPRATEQRNVALTWLRQHRTRRDTGVVFFADDDNTYSLELFDEMRSTKGVSVWPVGFVGGRAYERPWCLEGKWWAGTLDGDLTDPLRLTWQSVHTTGRVFKGLRASPTCASLFGLWLWAESINRSPYVGSTVRTRTVSNESPKHRTYCFSAALTHGSVWSVTVGDAWFLREQAPAGS